jgi:hypothetical protein
LEIALPPPGISANIPWGEKYEKGEEKREKMKTEKE